MPTPAVNLATSIAKAKARAKPTTSAAPVQLDIWPDRIRVIPNPMARCALFTAAGKKEAREHLKRQQLVALGAVEISYSGEELRQDDQDVWLQVVHIARQIPLGDRVEATAHSLLMAIGWGRSSDNYARLRASIMRMTEATVWITHEGLNPWSGRLIAAARMQGEDSTGGGAWALQLDPKIIALFAPQDTAHIDWGQRMRLKPLAKWLHSFYATHREPFAFKVATLHQLCGSRASRVAHFRASLMGSLDELVANGFLAEWAHDPRTDMITVTRRHPMPALTA